MARQILTDPHERDEFMRQIIDDWTTDTTDRSEWLEDKESWILLYNNVPPAMDPKYDGDPNFVVPVTMTVIETIQSRLMAAIFGLDDVFQAQPYGVVDPEQLNTLVEFMNWEIIVEMRAIPIIDDWIKDILMYGVSTLYIGWRRDVRTDKRIETFPADAPPMYPAMREVFEELNIPITEGRVPDKRYLEVLFDVDARIQSLGDGEFIVRYDQDNVEKKAQVYVNRDRSDITGDVEIEILEESILYDGPEIEVINPEDFIMPAGQSDIAKTPRCYRRRYMTYDEIARGVQYGDYDLSEDELEKLEEARDTDNASRRQSDLNRQSINNVRDDVTGVNSSSARTYEFEVVDAFYFWDVNDDGYDEDIVITFIPEFKMWLSGQYLSVLYPHKRRPFVPGRIIRRTNQYEGIGMAEITAPFQAELSAILNNKMRKDEFTSTPWGAYRPGSGVAPRLQKLAPGDFIPVDDPRNDFVVHQLSANSVTDVANINMITQLLEKLTGVSDFSAGTFGSRPNTPRTFGATAAIIQEGNVRYDMYMRRISEPIGEIADHVHALNDVFMPDEKTFFVVGKNLPRTIDRTHMRGRYNYRIISNTRNSNKAIMRDFITVVYQNLVANPLIASNTRALYKLAKMFAESHEFRNFDDVLPEPPEAQQRPPMDQMAEISLMAQGEAVDVLPTDDDAQHIELLMTFLEGPMADNFPREYSAFLLRHLQQHNEQLQLKQQTSAGGATSLANGPAGGPPQPSPPVQGGDGGLGGVSPSPGAALGASAGVAQ